VPESLSFKSYTKQRPKRSKTGLENASLASSELLLQTSSHPRLDFTGNEGENELESLWNHYVAVYDPDAGTLQLAEARKMTVRACVRLLHVDSDLESEGELAAVRTLPVFSISLAVYLLTDEPSKRRGLNALH
jgi:DNA-directed RNA polymerase I subunit RPA49